MKSGKYLAECLGTFALTFVGAGAIIATSGENLLVIALAHGIILAVMVAAMMHVSGAQFNPAVSIALATRENSLGRKRLFFQFFKYLVVLPLLFYLKQQWCRRTPLQIHISARHLEYTVDLLAQKW